MEAIFFVTGVNLQGELGVLVELVLLTTMVGGENLFASGGSAVDRRLLLLLFNFLKLIEIIVY